MYVKGEFCAHVYWEETCHYKHEQSGTSKLTWEHYISYSTVISGVLGSFKAQVGSFNWYEMYVDFIISGICSIFNHNSYL